MYIIEYLQDSTLQTAFVLEEQDKRLRVLLPNRREQSVQENRVLPWSGPKVKNLDSKEDMVSLLNSHIEKRQSIAQNVDSLLLWEMVQGEVEKADIAWLAELIFSQTDADILAGVARALLQDKGHFRFSPPNFEIFPESLVIAKKEAEEQQKKRERFQDGGMSWFKTLWDVKFNNKTLPECHLDDEVQERLKKLLLYKLTDSEFPDTAEGKDDDMLWRSIIKAVPEDSFAPYFLANAWKLIPNHYNFWFDRAHYESNEQWHEKYSDEVQALIQKAEEDNTPICDLPFVSIDSATTRDIDDACYVEKSENGYVMTLSLACPAAFWNFDTAFAKCIAQRATSVYLPEGTYHMLPEQLGTQKYSLVENTFVPSLIIKMTFDNEGELLACEPSRARVKIYRNLNYTEVEEFLENGTAIENVDSATLESMTLAYELAQKLLQKRLANNAVILNRPEPYIEVVGFNSELEEKVPAYYENVIVSIKESKENAKSQLLVSEAMVAANSAIALWAVERQIPLLFRSQDIAIPKEYAGVWSNPEDVARIARTLVAASMDTEAKPHAGMGIRAYAPISSPLRRYSDLINEYQILTYLEQGEAHFDKDKLDRLLMHLNATLENVTLIQRMRPRYWKLMYCKQESKKAMEKGHDYIWRAVVTEEFENFYSIALPNEQLFFRVKRAFMPDKVTIGQELMVRLGKINPLRNEIQVLGVEENF